MYRKIIAFGLMTSLLFGLSNGTYAAGSAVGLSPRKAIYQAARTGNVKAVENLVRQGFSLETVDSNGNTALCASVALKDVTAYNTLIAAGADPNADCMKNMSAARKERFCAGRGIADRSICTGVAKSGIITSNIWADAAGVAVLGTVAVAAASGGGGGGGSSGGGDDGGSGGGSDSGLCANVDCGFHGNCDSNTGTCICETGWSGTYCTEQEDVTPSCDDVDCGDHGTCNAGACICADGWSGSTCNIAPDACYNVSCGAHGSCSNGTCSCRDGFSGTNCEVPPTTELTEETTMDEQSGVPCDDGEVINGVCTKPVQSGNDEHAVVEQNDPDATTNPLFLAEFGGNVENTGDVERSGSSTEQFVGMWANGVGADALSPGGSTVDLTKASKATNSGTLTLTEETVDDKGIIGMKATSAGTIKNTGTIDLTTKSPNQSAAMLAKGKGLAVENQGIINLNPTESSWDMTGMSGADRNVLNDTDGQINIVMGQKTSGLTTEKGSVVGMTGDFVLNRGTITAKVDDTVPEGQTVQTDLRLIEAGPNGMAFNDGTINLDITNMMFNVSALAPSGGASGAKLTNNGTMNVTGDLYYDSALSKQVYLMGTADTSSTLLNEGLIDVDIDVSKGGLFGVMNGNGGTQTNNKDIKVKLTSVGATDGFYASVFDSQAGSQVNNGTVDVTFAPGVANSSSFFTVMDYHGGEGGVDQTNNGLIRMTSEMDGLSVVAMTGAGAKVNGAEGEIHLISSANNSSLAAIGGGGGSANNSGKVFLEHNGGSGSIVGFGGANEGKIYIRANDMTGMTGINGASIAPGGATVDDSKGLIDIKLTGSTYGAVAGASVAGAGTLNNANKVSIEAKDSLRAGDLMAVGMTVLEGAQLNRGGDTIINVNGSTSGKTQIWGLQSENAHITNNGDIRITSDLTNSNQHVVIGMESQDTQRSELTQYKAINNNRIRINVTGGKSSIHRDGIPFDVVGMATNSYAENSGTGVISINVSGDAKAAGMVAYDAGQIVNKGTIIFTGNADNFTPFYGTGLRNIDLAWDKDGNVIKKTTVYASVYNGGDIIINNMPISITNAQGHGYEGSGWARRTYDWVENDEEGNPVNDFVLNKDETNVDSFTEYNTLGTPFANVEDVTTPSFILNNGVRYVSEQNGTLNANGSHLIGEITAGTSLALNGNKDIYIGDGKGSGAVIGDGDFSDLTFVSDSPLFTAGYRINDKNSNGLDIVLTRRSFADVVSDASLADYLERNYVAGYNESFFNELKSFNNRQSLMAGLNQMTGRDMLSRFNFEDMTMIRELNVDMNNQLFRRPEAAFATAGIVKPMAFSGDIGSESRYSLFNKRRGNLSVGFGVAFTDVRSDDTHNSNDRKETMYQLVVPVGYRAAGMHFITSPRIGYARGNYDRVGFNNQSYDGTMEKRIFGLMNEARYPMTFGDWTVEPAAELNVLGMSQRGKEDRKDYSLNIKSQNTYSVESGIGLYLTRAEELSKDSRVKLTAGVAGYHEFADPYRLDVGMNGLMGTFRLRDEKRSDNRGIIRLGLDYDYRDLSVYGSFISYIDREVRSAVKSGMKLKF
ncbi:MAG: hypothetical protein IJV07_01020 [Alphaproteobacteria bacterium]|nr:hypothetical protein [Alphaproteobacteria bacterium]